MYETIIDNLPERRRAFIADWRERMMLRLADLDGERSFTLEEMDARKCNGEMKERVAAAIDAKLTALSHRSASTPVRLSNDALKSLDQRRV